jgi:hypothetical protein
MTVVRPVHDTLDVVTREVTPNALLPLAVGPALMVEMTNRDVARGGSWRTVPAGWQRWDRGWLAADEPGEARLLGTIYVLHGTPTPYDAVIYRVTVTPTGTACGWSPTAIADDALRLVGLSLADCGRVAIASSPAMLSSAHVAPGNRV